MSDNNNEMSHAGRNNDATASAALSLLPKLYSTIEEVDNDLREGRQPQPSSPTIEPPRAAASASSESAAHLFLHFDVNETILIGDPAGGDSVEECLNKVIAKSAFVSTKDQIEGKKADDSNNKAFQKSLSSGNMDPADNNSSTHHLKPTLWWNGLPIDINNESNAATTESFTKVNSSPPPLYTGWTWPPNTCPYYRTSYKKQYAKKFAQSEHAKIYAPLYQHLCNTLGVSLEGKENATKNNDSGAQSQGEQHDIFANFLPAFFHTLQHYFPSTKNSSNQSESNDSYINNNNHLPVPPKVTLVLRTFGTDLPRVAQCISEFARGNHPSYPSYYNPKLILDEGDLFQSRWRHCPNREEWIYELHPANATPKGNDDATANSNEGDKSVEDGENAQNDKDAVLAGDAKVLQYLQSKTIVGIQDNYPFWRDANFAPWAGKPVWARRTINTTKSTNSTNSEGKVRKEREQSFHNHHHILLDDNIHNDPDDGAGGIRVLTSNMEYDSLHGVEGLKMHGKHLIRVPTIRPLLEEDWFVRQIEKARLRVALEEEEEKGRNEKVIE